MSSVRFDAKYPVVLLGDSGTGKTSLSPSLAAFNRDEAQTAGVNFYAVTMTVDGKLVQLQVWDTAGQERFRSSVTSSYIPKAKAIVLTYDLTNQESFTNLTMWLNLVRSKKRADDKDYLIYLVGTKKDLVDKMPADQLVKEEEASAFAQTNNLIYCDPMDVTDKKAGQNTSSMQTFYEKIARDAYVKQFGADALAAPKQEDAKSSVAPPSNLQLSFSKRRKTASIVTGIVAGVAVALALSLLAYFFWPVIVTMGFIVAGAAALGINLTATAILGTVLGGLGAAGLFGTGVGFFTNFMYPKVASRLGATSQSESSSKPRRDSIPLMPVGTPSTNPQPGSQPSAQLDPAAPQSQQNAEPYVAGSPRV